MHRYLSFPEPGWVLAVLLATADDDDGRYRIGRLPVVAMFVTDDNELEPVVAMSNGQILPASKIGLDVICLAGPDEDVEKVARAALATRESISPSVIPSA